MNANSKVATVALKILKISWIPILLAIALLIGMYVGYWFITDTSGANIFSKETWQMFFSQIQSLR